MSVFCVINCRQISSNKLSFTKYRKIFKIDFNETCCDFGSMENSCVDQSTDHVLFGAYKMIECLNTKTSQTCYLAVGINWSFQLMHYFHVMRK